MVHADHIGASTFIEKGWSRLSLGDYDGAETALKKAIELSPGDPQSEALLGWAQMLNEKYDEALANFQKVLMREPSNALARINVGYICLKKRTFGEAIEHLSKAIRLDNDKKATLYAHFYLGLVYLEREMYEDAENFFQKTLVLGPNLIEAYLRDGARVLVQRPEGGRDGRVEARIRGEQVQSVGQAVRGDAEDGRSGRRSRRAPERARGASQRHCSPPRSLSRRRSRFGPERSRSIPAVSRSSPSRATRAWRDRCSRRRCGATRSRDCRVRRRTCVSS